MPPSRTRHITDPDAFERTVFGGRPFVGTAAVDAGIITAHDLRVRFTRVLPGVHLAKGFAYDAPARVRAAGLWAPPGAVLAGHAAALIHGDPHVSPEHVHRAVDLYLPRTARAPGGIRIHPLRKPLQPDEVVERGALHYTSIGRTAVDLARWQRDPLAATIAVDAVCNATMTPLDEVTRYANSLRGLHGRRRALELFDRCDHRADSPRETRLRLILVDSSLPDPEPQVRIVDSNGQHIATADLGYREQKVALFYDGEHHLNREQRDWDSGVTARLFDEGWLDLRVTQGMLANPATIRRRTAEMLHRQGFPIHGVPGRGRVAA